MNRKKLSRSVLCLALAAGLLFTLHAEAQYVFTTIDDPVAVSSNGNTYVTGISGDTVVGYYFGSVLHGFYHQLGTTNYTTIDEPLGYVNGSSSTQPFGISGPFIVGNYQNYQGNAAGYYGFLYNITNGTFETLDDPNGDFQSASHTWPRGIDGTNIIGYLSENLSIYDGAIAGFEAQYTGSGFAYGEPFYNPTISKITVAAGYNTTNYTTYVTGISGSNAVGYYLDQNNVTYGFIYNLVAGTYTALVSPGGGGCPVTGIDGNNVVGYYADPLHSYNYSGFVYNMASSNFTATSIRDPLAPGNTFLTGISGNKLVGYFLDNSVVNHGFVASIPIPVMNLLVSPTNLVVKITNGISGATVHLISTSDLTLPANQWSVLTTNTFNTNGVLQITNPIIPVAPATFYGVSEVP